MKNLIEKYIKIEISPMVYEAVRNYPSGSIYPLEDYQEDDETITEEDKVYYLEAKIRDMIIDLTRLFNFTRKRLQGYFTIEEVYILLRAFWNTLYHVGSIDPRKIIIASIEDVLKYESFDFDEEGINIAKGLIEKIQKLTPFEAYVTILLTCSLKKNNLTEDDIRETFMIE
ncbi:hypothetical protein Calow_2030 [Caldicellulosiruptor owensensis OL]|uniref:Uncharacterized protein n=1 Tax=Caldicellulosiruptor owensensis (strain ATCC 700167 / DSM 13100 / OL) TaxID=632518 RepID=E4Q656_CALOW|nr:hypothetical protein [Caldicellulosiruptor owensensis]ADQ05541.1 hypothetical protein Calow_2030 [Caldicellulosiruptor owensensis OL]